MAEKSKKRNRSSGGSGSIGVSIVSFLLGFLFAFIVLIGSIFGVGYVALKTDINEVFRVFGLENVNENAESNDDKYNYINADQAPDILSLIQEVMKMANDGLGEINLNKIDALAPVTDAVLDMAYGFIDGVVDFDKEYFRNVPLTSIIDCVTNSMYYVRTSKIIETLNTKMGYSINLDAIPIAGYMVDGVEAQYATVTGGTTGNIEGFKLPVLFDYYVCNKLNDEYSYNRTIPVGTDSAYPDNLKVDGKPYYIYETTLNVNNNTTDENTEGAEGGVGTEGSSSQVEVDDKEKKLYKVFYVPCKLTDNGIEETVYKVKDNPKADPNVSFTKDGNTVNLRYNFRTVEYDKDTDFIAVKPEVVNGVETFVLDFDTLHAAKQNNQLSRYLYSDPYARSYYSEVEKRTENEAMYGISTINNINFFKDNAGNVVEYDPLTVSDVMLDALKPLNNVPVSTVVDENQAEIVKGIFGDTSLGDILNQNVNFNDLVNDIYLSTFIKDVDKDDKVMAYITYNITDITDDGAGNYTAIYDKNGENRKAVKVTIDDSTGKNLIKSVTDPATGEEIKGHTVKDMTTLTDNLTIDVLMDVDPDDAIMTYIGYGVYDIEKVDGQTGYSHVGKYDVVIDSVPVTKDVYIASETDGGGITSVWYMDGENKVTVKGTKIDAVPDRVSTLKDKLTIGEIITVDSSSTMILQAIKDTTISGLNDKIKTLTVKDVLEPGQINNNKILPQIADTKITELGSAIDKVLIQRIYAKEIYGLAEDGDPTLATEFNPAYLYYEKVDDGNGGYKYVLVDKNCAGKTGTEYDNALGKLTQADWDNRGDTVYYTYGEAKGMWKLILYRVDGTTKTEKAYTLNNFNNMVSACSTTVYNSTLNELKDAEIIGNEIDRPALAKKLKTVVVESGTPTIQYIKVVDGNISKTPNESEATPIGNFTLKQLLVAITSSI